MTGIKTDGKGIRFNKIDITQTHPSEEPIFLWFASRIYVHLHTGWNKLGTRDKKNTKDFSRVQRLILDSIDSIWSNESSRSSNEKNARFWICRTRNY